MQIGNVEAWILSDGTMNQDAGGIFGVVPRILWEQVETPDEFNRVPTALNCLLVISDKKKILIDNGLGDKLTPKQESNFGRQGGSALLVNLARLGFQPGDIDIVIDTHLHVDHCGGNTRRTEDGIVPTFPRAQYWVQRLELADASYPNERTKGTYFADNFKPLEGYALCPLNGDTRVTDEVRCVVTPGHTRGHQSVIIESRGEKAIFLGDAIARVVNMERPAWIPAYDLEPLESLETNRRIRDWALEEKAVLIFQHDPRLALGRLTKDGDRWRVEPARE